MQASNLYPTPQITSVERYEYINLRSALPVNEELAKANSRRVVEYLNGDNAFSEGLLTTIFSSVQMLNSTPHFANSRKRLCLAPRSFMTVQVGSERYLFLSRRERVHPERGTSLQYPYRRINRFVAVTLGSDGAVRDICEFVKIFFHFNPEGEDLQIRSAEKELRTLSIIDQLQSEFTPRTFALVKYKGNRGTMLALFQQYISPDLHQYFEITNQFGNIPVPIRMKMAREITRAVQFVHQKGFIHRDIKLENFLIQVVGDSVRIFITDFGLSRHVQDEKLKQAIPGTVHKYGTYKWSAPELVESEENPQCIATVDQKSDFWSLGLILYALAGLIHPTLHILSKVNALIDSLEQIEKDVKLLDDARSAPSNPKFWHVVNHVTKSCNIAHNALTKEDLDEAFDATIWEYQRLKHNYFHQKRAKLGEWRSSICTFKDPQESTLLSLKVIAEKLLQVEPDKRATLEEILPLLH